MCYACIWGTTGRDFIPIFGTVLTLVQREKRSNQKQIRNGLPAISLAVRKETRSNLHKNECFRQKRMSEHTVCSATEAFHYTCSITRVRHNSLHKVQSFELPCLLSLLLGQLWLNLDPFRLVALLFGIAFHHQLVLLSYHPIFLLPYHFLKLLSFLWANRTKISAVGPWLLKGAI